MSGLSKFWHLSGEASFMETMPESCPSCGGNKFFKQADFKRSIGLTLVVIASLSTCVLFYYRMDWFLVWSPMLVALFFDRLFASLSNDAAICYDCEHIIRGPAKEELSSLDAFDLEIYDRHKYQNQR